MKLILKILNILVLIGSLAIIVLVSIDTIYPGFGISEKDFLSFMTIVCYIFITDFCVRFYYSENKKKFFFTNFIFLLVSIPYMSILYHFDIEVTRFNSLLFRLGPFIRGGYGVVLIISWITRKGVATLFFSYLVMTLSFTYFCSLVFYELEKEINPMVKEYWNALTWACANVTTVGSNIYGVTYTGQALSFCLAAAGMMLFPIFTAYITDRFKTRKSKVKVKEIH